MDWFLGERHKRDKSAGRKRRETKGKRIALEQTWAVFSCEICSVKIYGSDTVVFYLCLVIIIQLLTN